MRHGNRLVCAGVLGSVALLVSGCGGAADRPQSYTHFIADGQYQGAYWPTTAWRTCRPEQVGMDPATLYRAGEYAARADFVTEGVAVIRRGYVVAEEYFRGHDASTRFSSFSVAKSFLSAVVGVAIADGHLPGIDQPAYPYFAAWRDLPASDRRRRITVGHLLTMRSGLAFVDASYDGIAGTDIEAILATGDSVKYVLALPSIHEPGSFWNYSGGDSILLSGMVEAASGRTAFALGKERIFDRIGLSALTWSSDRAGHTYGGWGVGATVREYARFGYLYVRNGAWDGSQIVPEAWVRQSRAPASETMDRYGHHWWLAPAINGGGRPVVPGDTLHAQGLYHQKIFVIPSLDLVVVRVGTDGGASRWSDAAFLAPIVDSVRD